MTQLKTVTSWLLALLCIGLVVINGLIPYVWVSQYTDPQFYAMLSGADPIITAYLENAIFTIPCLVIVMGLFALAAFRFVTQRSKAATPVIAASILIILSLAVSDHRGLTSLRLNPGELPTLIIAMALLIIMSLWVRQGHAKTS